MQTTHKVGTELMLVRNVVSPKPQSAGAPAVMEFFAGSTGAYVDERDHFGVRQMAIKIQVHGNDHSYWVNESDLEAVT